MIPSRLRLILCIELVAYYFAAPYIILLGLDEHRGLLGAGTLMNIRLWSYALLLSIYPFLLIIVSPCVGRQLDQRQSKISVLRKIHLANSVCYFLLAVASWQQSLVLALIGLSIPGIVGCAAPVGKSLIASLTCTDARVQEFGKLAFMKGVVKLCVPLIGAFIFQWVLGESGYGSLFLVSSALSFGCFLYSFTFPHICLPSDPAVSKEQSPTLSILVELVRKNYALLLIFVCLLTGYSVFVKFAPFVMFEKIGDRPSLVNYFASLVGLAYSLNQFMVVRYAKQIEKLTGAIFVVLCSFMLFLCLSNLSPLWFTGLFGVLFCFSVLATCIEARLSLQAINSTQGTVQGILYSMENWSYLLAPALGSLLASISTLYPLYFVTILTLCAALFLSIASFASRDQAVKVFLKPGREKSIIARHPWIFSGAIDKMPSFTDGDILAVSSADGEHLGFGYFNRCSNITGRMLCFDDTDPLDAIKRHIKQAIYMRKVLLGDYTNAIRLINAEGDLLPGLIVDQYKDALVLQCSTLGIERLKGKIVEILLQELDPSWIFEASTSHSRKEEGLLAFKETIYGTPMDEIEVFEGDLRFRRLPS